MSKLCFDTSSLCINIDLFAKDECIRFSNEECKFIHGMAYSRFACVYIAMQHRKLFDLKRYMILDEEVEMMV